MKSYSAYTLIELLIGLSIIAITFSVGIAGYREFSRRQAIVGVQKQVNADLRLAQQLALSGQKPDGCTKLDGYEFNSILTGYEIKAFCTNSTTTTKTVNFSNNFTISAGNVIFKVLGQGTNLSSSLVYTLTEANSGTSVAVTVGVGGEIN
jgi:prepilin-type N-terminal cleavage/methylation domain-containing protein